MLTLTDSILAWLATHWPYILLYMYCIWLVDTGPKQFFVYFVLEIICGH